MFAAPTARDDLRAHTDFRRHALLGPAEIDGPAGHHAVANRVDEAVEHVGGSGLPVLRELQVFVNRSDSLTHSSRESAPCWTSASGADTLTSRVASPFLPFAANQ
jgi:hypothetical protein